MKIGHFARGISALGGIGSYVRLLTRAQSIEGNSVYLFDSERSENKQIIAVESDEHLLLQAAELGLDVLHTHNLIKRGSSTVPIVRTIHSHHPYCPSGGRFFHASHRPCPRTFSWQGCLYGHFIDRCGSIRLGNLINNFSISSQEREELPKQHCIAISQFVRSEMIRAGYDEKRITLVHHPAPIEPDEEFSFSNSSGTPRFVFVGRITPEKGLDWVIRAIAKMSTKIELEVLGVGNDTLHLQKLASELGISDRFKWSGWISDQQEVQARIKQARAVVFPSLWPEPAGLVTLEAAAAGRALIGSRVGGIPDYADRLKHAILVEPGDLEGMVHALNQLAEDSAKAEQLGRSGWQSLKEGAFSIKGHLKELEAVYLKAIG